MPPKSRSEVPSLPAARRTHAEGPVTLQSHILQQEALPPATPLILGSAAEVEHVLRHLRRGAGA
jgi:hypothetical protein